MQEKALETIPTPFWLLRPTTTTKKLPSKGQFLLKGDLQFYYVLSLWATVALNDVELNFLTFVQSFETVTLDCAEVYEYIVSAFYLNETETFFCVKPFYCSVRLHLKKPPKIQFEYASHIYRSK